jgi:hypothetical protein
MVMTTNCEWSVIEETCKRRMGLPHEDIKQLISDADFDWGRLIGLGIKNRIVPFLAKEIIPFLSDKHGSIAHFFRGELNLNRHRLQVYRHYLNDVVQGLQDAGIKVMARKGLVLSHLLYNDDGSRFFCDLDFFISPENAETAKAVMVEKGYRHGSYFDQISGTLKDYSRKDLLIYKISPDHLPEFSKTIDDPLVESIKVDLATSISWFGSDIQLPPSVVMGHNHEYRIGGFQVPSFDPLMIFVDTLMHLYRETYLLRFAKGSLRINKFMDVYLLFQKFNEVILSAEGQEFLEGNELTKPVVWVFDKIDEIFDSEVMKSLPKSWLQPDGLDSYQGTGGVVFKDLSLKKILRGDAEIPPH